MLVVVLDIAIWMHLFTLHHNMAQLLQCTYGSVGQKMTVTLLVSDFDFRRNTSARARRGEHVTRGKHSNFRRANQS